MTEQHYKSLKVTFATWQALTKLTAQTGETRTRIIERLVNQEYRVISFQERKLIAIVQALIAAHRYPAMYNVEGVIADAEAAWKEANEELLRQDNATRR